MNKQYGPFSWPVIISGIGYFVDLYDILLFSIVRMASLREIGIAEGDLFSTGVFILNMQVLGLIVGGLAFGMLGDKFGRTKLLFISIITYSLATLGCAFVQSVPVYAFLRFVTGMGMAGEVGLAITLVAEITPKHKRGYATAVVAALGICGAGVAAILSKYLDWRTCYVIGAVMGFAIFLLRSKMVESFMFAEQRVQSAKGSLRLLLQSPKRCIRFILIVLVGAPVIFCTIFLGSFAPELTKDLGLTVPMTAADGILYVYFGLAAGDAVAGILSQYFKTRRRIVQIFLLGGMALGTAFLLLPHQDNINIFRAYYFALGFLTGFWVVICTMAAEMFGTNLRATVASATPNFMRASLLPINYAILWLKPAYGLIPSAFMVGSVLFIAAFIAITLLPETHGLDLSYEEQ